MGWLQWATGTLIAVSVGLASLWARLSGKPRPVLASIFLCLAFYSLTVLALLWLFRLVPNGPTRIAIGCVVAGLWSVSLIAARRRARRFGAITADSQPPRRATRAEVERFYPENRNRYWEGFAPDLDRRNELVWAKTIEEAGRDLFALDITLRSRRILRSPTLRLEFSRSILEAADLDLCGEQGEPIEWRRHARRERDRILLLTVWDPPLAPSYQLRLTVFRRFTPEEWSLVGVGVRS